MKKKFCSFFHILIWLIRNLLQKLSSYLIYKYYKFYTEKVAEYTFALNILTAPTAVQSLQRISDLMYLLILASR
jgi:hypothetical protein